MKFQDCQATRLTEKAMQRIKATLGPMPTADYNRTFTAIYEAMREEFPPPKEENPLTGMFQSQISNTWKPNTK